MAKLKRTANEEWRCVLEGEISGHFCWKPWVRRVSRAIPSEPRCKLCHTPFGAPGNVLRFVGFGPSRLNRRICSGCVGALEKKPGGAEVNLSLLFADVRGSTSLAERMGAEAFSQLMARFYGAAAAVVDRRDGIVDKFVGDEVVALFIPGFAGPDHADAAIAAAVNSLRRPDTGTESRGSPSELPCTQELRTSGLWERETPWISRPSETPSTRQLGSQQARAWVRSS